VLHALKDLGVTLAIDDFGTGYSSLSYLQRFPLDILKIDKTFVDELGMAPEGSEIIAAVIKLAHALGLQVIAEGVESEQQLEELERLDCDFAQGYLFSRPGPGPRTCRGLPGADRRLTRRRAIPDPQGAACPVQARPSHQRRRAVR
jgi:EAL domain-containing protein (putative c-di-GMP-specific phosphodiesterase class I)